MLSVRQIENRTYAAISLGGPHPSAALEGRTEVRPSQGASGNECLETLLEWGNRVLTVENIDDVVKD